MSKDRKFWGVTTPRLPAAFVAAHAKQLEDMGLEGVFAPQVYGPPFLPLAAAATSTERVKLASGIALAFARSPFETAMAAIDLDRMSGGRFVLGLGPSVRAWSEGMFGMPYGKPLAHLREVVEAIRLIVAKAHTGDLDDFEGEYVNLDFSALQPPPEPPRTEIPIWIAALRGPLVSLAAEIADGVIGHPMWSIRWAVEEMSQPLAEGLARAGRARDEVEVNLWFWVAPNRDVAEAIDDARATVAFYGAAAQYEPYFAWHGFGDVAKGLQEAGLRHDATGARDLVPDEMVRAFVICGSPDECRAQLEPVWEMANSVTLVPPAYAISDEKTMSYATAIADTFYG